MILRELALFHRRLLAALFGRFDEGVVMGAGPAAGVLGTANPSPSLLPPPSVLPAAADLRVGRAGVFS